MERIVQPPAQLNSSGERESRFGSGDNSLVNECLSNAGGYFPIHRQQLISLNPRPAAMCMFKLVLDLPCSARFAGGRPGPIIELAQAEVS